MLTCEGERYFWFPCLVVFMLNVSTNYLYLGTTLCSVCFRLKSISKYIYIFINYFLIIQLIIECIK